MIYPTKYILESSIRSWTSSLVHDDAVYVFENKLIFTVLACKQKKMPFLTSFLSVYHCSFTYACYDELVSKTPPRLLSRFDHSLTTFIQEEARCLPMPLLTVEAPYHNGRYLAGSLINRKINQCLFHFVRNF